jgi:signal transduction histidine kinase
VLRGADAASTAPAPGLDRLPELVDSIRAHGVEVDECIDVGTAAIDPLTELTAYRVIQESLTNVGRHAHASRVRIEVVRTQDALVIDVVDDGVTAWREPGPSGGFGLRGMRERVAAVGGRIEYGPVDGGGWAVHADLPLEPGA